MKLRTWPILALGFGTLVLLTILLGFDAWRRANQINTTIVAIHDSQARAEEALREIETGIYLSSIFAEVRRRPLYVVNTVTRSQGPRDE